MTRVLIKNKYLIFKKKNSLYLLFYTDFCQLFSLIKNGLNQGVDFVGGRSYTVRFDKPVNPTEINSILNSTFGSAEVKTFGEENQLKITTKYKVDTEDVTVDEEIQNMLYKALIAFLPQSISYEDFVKGSSEKNIGIMSSIKVGPTIADDIKNNSFLAILGSLIVISLHFNKIPKVAIFVGAVTAVFTMY